MSERANERAGERAGGRAGGQAGGRAGERASERVSESVSEHVCVLCVRHSACVREYVRCVCVSAIVWVTARRFALTCVMTVLLQPGWTLAYYTCFNAHQVRTDRRPTSLLSLDSRCD